MTYFNPSKVKDNLMPDGEYPVKAIGGAIVDTKKGTKQYKIELVIEGPRYAGKHLWATHSMAKEHFSFIKGSLTALGLDTKADRDINLEEDVKGRRAIAVVIHDDYGEKVKRLRTIKDGVPGTSNLDDTPF